MGRVDADALKHFVSALLCGQGSDATEAEIVADHLVPSPTMHSLDCDQCFIACPYRLQDSCWSDQVTANLKGHDSHGVGMLPQYFNSIQRGLLNPNQALHTVSDTGPMLVFDAGQGYGQRAAHEALLIGAERAKQHGVCVYALRRASHIGRVGT